MRPGDLIVASALLLALSSAAEAGEELAYTRLTDGFWQIWTFDEAADSHKQRTTSAFDKGRATWGPDGALLYRSGNDELYRLAENREHAWRKDSWPAADPAWSENAPSIAIARLRTDLRDESAIWTLGPGPDARRVLTVGPGFRMHPSWSRDGTTVAYVLSFGAKGTEIRRFALGSSKPEVIHGDSSHNAYPSFNPDGTALTYASDRDGNYEIYVLELDGGGDQRLTRRLGLDTSPTWSPDGSRIAYTSFREGRLVIWWTDPEGKREGPLFSIDADARDPAWR